MTRTPIENLKSDLKEAGCSYADDFCAGWRRAALGDSLASTKKIQDDNSDYRDRTERGSATTGMVDGWHARNEIYP